jgi:hypothetical protein
MSIDVVYQGLSIAKEARVHFEEGGLFVEVDAPMPVATQLVLSHSDKTPTSTFLGRVRRIREGAAPGTTPPAGHTSGMLIAPVESEKLPRWLMALHKDTASAAEFEAEVAVEKAPAPAVEKAPAPAVEKAPAPVAEKPAEQPAEPVAEKAAESATAPSTVSPASSEPAADAAPSSRTPDDADEKKPSGGGTSASKKKKSKRR